MKKESMISLYCGCFIGGTVISIFEIKFSFSMLLILFGFNLLGCISALVTSRLFEKKAKQPETDELDFGDCIEDRDGNEWYIVSVNYDDCGRLSFYGIISSDEKKHDLLEPCYIDGVNFRVAGEGV